MNIGLVLVIILILCLLGGLPLGVYNGPYAYHYGGGFGLIVVVLIILLLLGRI